MPQSGLQQLDPKALVLATILYNRAGFCSGMVSGDRPDEGGGEVCGEGEDEGQPPAALGGGQEQSTIERAH